MRYPYGSTVLLLAATLLCGFSPTYAQETVDLIVLHINDSHGSLEPVLGSDSTRYGGAVHAAALIQDIRRQTPDRVLLLHAGDLFSRGDPVVAFSGGGANLEILERIGVDALTPGNGDFYFGVENLVEQTAHVDFPVLHANIRHEETGTRLFPAYTMLEVSGVRVAILGLGNVRMGHHSARALELLNPIEVARQFAPVLRPQADLLIVLSHLGTVNDTALASAVPEIDLIVGGHSHTRLDSLFRVSRPPNPVAIGVAQASPRYAAVGRVDVRMRRTEDGYSVERLDGRLLPVTSDIPRDPDVESVLAEYEQQMNEVVATLDSTLVSPDEGYDPLGELVAVSMRWVTGADISMVHRGWVGDSLEAGPVTMEDVIRVHSAREPVLTAKLKGSRVTRLGQLTRRLFSGCDIEDSTVVRIGGAAVDTNAFYTLAATAYAFNSVDALEGVTTSRTGYRIDTAIERYLRMNGSGQAQQTRHRLPNPWQDEW